jgi:hypothetical protein
VKSANGNLALLSLNSPDEIVKVTGAALLELSAYRNASSRELRLRPDAWQAFLAATGTALGTTTGLRQLDGVALRTASAILAILNPELFPVIDRWSVAGLYSPIPGRTVQESFVFYAHYMRTLADLQLGGVPGTVHELDQAPYNAAKDGTPSLFGTVPPPP